MSRILVPSGGAEGWKQFLADPKHWRTGFSARALAHCWEDANGELPSEIADILRTDAEFAGAVPLLAIPEHKVSLPGGSRASQTDLWLLLRTANALASVAVEGKVAEPFGESLGEWLEEASSGKERRIAAIRELLGISDIPETIRYQLLHRTASAILEAERFHAPHAVMLVHSFSQSDQWFDDFASFVELLGGTPAKGRLIPAPGRQRPSLHVGWVRGDARYLER